jgi:hypothetical protein
MSLFHTSAGVPSPNSFETDDFFVSCGFTAVVFFVVGFDFALGFDFVFAFGLAFALPFFVLASEEELSSPLSE